MTHRSKWLGGAALLAVLSLGTGSTVAYQTAFDKKSNLITVAGLTTEIQEEFPSPAPITPDGDTEYKKTVRVTNSGKVQSQAEADCYVRISIGYSDSRIGNAVQLQGLDTQNWIKGSDGFYYYSSVLKSGASTTPLFTGFTVDAEKIEAGDTPLPEDFQIQIYEESIQAAGFTGYSQAWAAYETTV